MEAKMDYKLTMSEAQRRVLTAQNELLTGELGKARFEVDALQKQLKRMEEEWKRLEQQLMKKQMEELEGDVGGDMDLNYAEVHICNGMHPMNVFPEEIWLMIFGFLADSRDLKSCYETSPVFHRLLNNERSVALFNDVLKVITAPGNGLWILPPRELTFVLKKCRLVCQAWKGSVEELLQQDCPIIPHMQNKTLSSTFTLFSFGQNPWNDAGLRSLNFEMNPIPSRYLVYHENCTCKAPDKKRASLHHSLKAFLEKFGHQVWFFKATYSPAGRDASWYTALLTCLSLMPNLKSLFIQRPMGKWWTTDTARQERDIGFSTRDCDMESLDNNRPPVPIDQMKALKDATFWSHAPTIKSLKTVVFEDCPPVVIAAILNSNPQVERLKIERDPLNQVTLDLSLCKVEQLKEVWLSLPHLKGHMDGLEGVNWTNLKKLHLQALFVNWTTLFETLEKRLGNTLEELELSLRGPSRSEFLRLGLPNLKVLKLTLQRHFQSIDFILPLNKLEQLSVDLTHMYQYQYEKRSPVGSVGSIGYDYKPIAEIVETIKIHQYTHNLKDSNIWKLFPKLKTVKARTDRKYGCDASTPKVDFKWQTCTRRLED